MNKFQLPIHYWKRHIGLFNLMVGGAGLISVLLLKYFDIFWTAPMAVIGWFLFVNALFFGILILIGMAADTLNKPERFSSRAEVAFWWTSIILAIWTGLSVPVLPIVLSC
ncbi:MAG: hypothetical protein EOP50_00635 [Sphingobacteriales bacterium]|nr:MAG: hypothetical protein EOP50_00635 [Sphingobacteriales bacterium]